MCALRETVIIMVLEFLVKMDALENGCISPLFERRSLGNLKT